MLELNPVGIVLLVVLAALLLAWAAPRRYQVRVTRELPFPPERVWHYLEDPGRFAHWFPFVVEARHAGGPERGIGQRRRLELDRNGAAGEREEEAMRWEEGAVLVLEHRWEKTNGHFVRWTEARSEFHLTATEQGTSVKGVLWFSGVGAVGRVQSLLFLRKRHEQDFQAALANLERRLTEESWTD